MNFAVLLLAWFLTFLFSITLHEAAHALAAWKLGDKTAYEGGQVTIDPIVHIKREPLGMILVPLISFFLYQGSWMLGWASCPYDPSWAYKYPRKAAWMAAAGPAANLLLVIISGIMIILGLHFGLFRLGDFETFADFIYPVGEGLAGPLAMILSIGFMLNLVLFCFNLLPVPPLDGSAIITLVMREEQARKFNDLMRTPGFAIIGLIIAWHVFPLLFKPVMIFSVQALFFFYLLVS